MPKIHCLHGFLGLPGDWDFLVDELEHDVVAWDWAQNFSKCFDFKTLTDSLLKQYSNKINDGDCLLGYSLGGRILLHLLPHLDKKVKIVIVAAHPGLQDYKEKEKRLLLDLEWSQKFLRLPWEHLIPLWNSADIFNQKIPYARNEGDFKRELLAHTLLGLSLGRQKPLEIPKDALYLAGEKDLKFKEISEKLNCRKIIVSDCYHRLPWEKNDQFKQILRGFLYE